jgi:hypothetical protein
MAVEVQNLGATVEALRPMVPAKDFEVSRRFYVDLGFHPQVRIPDRLIEMHLGSYSFMLQNYYVQQWADNFVMHMGVTDVRTWWNHIVSLDLPARYGVKTMSPQDEGWALVAGVIDPSGVLWRISQRAAGPDYS